MGGSGINRFRFSNMSNALRIRSSFSTVMLSPLSSLITVSKLTPAFMANSFCCNSFRIRYSFNRLPNSDKMAMLLKSVQIIFL